MEVVLIGKGPGFEQAPLKGEGVTTWGVNDACGHRECDVVFWMDRCWEKDNQTDRVIVSSVNLTKTPLYSTQEWDDIPTSKRYPLEEITRRFGVDYFTDSFSYMMALAIFQGYTEISTYGFNYGWGTNYVKEKPGVEFWLGMALMSGATLNLYGEHCDLLKTNHDRHDPETLYAYGVPQTMERTGIKMGEDVKREKKVFALSVQDRVAIIMMFPKTGSYETLKMVKWLNENLWFKQDEHKKLNLRQVQDDAGLPFFVWDDNDIPDMDIELDEPTQCLIATWLEQKDKDKMLGKEHFELYEKFCIGK
jgi:hypothetical protein